MRNKQLKAKQAKKTSKRTLIKESESYENTILEKSNQKRARKQAEKEIILKPALHPLHQKLLMCSDEDKSIEIQNEGQRPTATTAMAHTNVFGYKDDGIFSSLNFDKKRLSSK